MGGGLPLQIEADDADVDDGGPTSALVRRMDCQKSNPSGSIFVSDTNYQLIQSGVPAAGEVKMEGGRCRSGFHVKIGLLPNSPL